jgi:hypothetical protein
MINIQNIFGDKQLKQDILTSHSNHKLVLDYIYTVTNPQNIRYYFLELCCLQMRFQILVNSFHSSCVMVKYILITSLFCTFFCIVLYCIQCHISAVILLRKHSCTFL